MQGLITPSTFSSDTCGAFGNRAGLFLPSIDSDLVEPHHPTLPSYQEKQPLSSQDLDISLLSDDIMIAEIARQFFRDFPHLIGSSTLCRIRAWSFSFIPANRLARVRPSFRRYHHIRKCNIRIPRFYSLGRSDPAWTVPLHIRFFRGQNGGIGAKLFLSVIALFRFGRRCSFSLCALMTLLFWCSIKNSTNPLCLIVLSMSCLASCRCPAWRSIIIPEKFSVWMITPMLTYSTIWHWSHQENRSTRSYALYV